MIHAAPATPKNLPESNRRGQLDFGENLPYFAVAPVFALC
jgi:hypothetical protein